MADELARLRLTIGRTIALFSRDPGRAGVTATIGVVGLALIWLWSLYGDFLLPHLVVVTAATLLAAAYAAWLALTVGGLVREQDRWQVESALTLRDLLSDRSGAGGPLAGWPFYLRGLRLRLDEEIRRAHDYGTPFTVAAMRLEVPGHAPSHALLSQANFEMADLVAAHPGALLAPTSLGLFEWAFLLPHHDRRAAQAMAEFIARTLRRYSCTFGLAVFPEDGLDVESLLHCAVDRCGVLETTAA